MAAHLELRVLASFLAVAEELNFTRAAKRLHMTQPPLSLQIKQLEGLLGTSLFERTNRRVRLTAAGNTLRIEAEKLIAMDRLAQQLVARVGRGEVGGHISIGFTAVASLKLVPDLLRHFNEQVPGIQYSLRDTSSDEQVSALLKNELDVGFLRPPIVDSRLKARCLSRESQILAIPTNHPLSTASRVNVGSLNGEVIVTYERRAGRYVHDLMMRWMFDHDVVPSRFHHVVHHNALMTVVSAGLGIALVPESVASRPIDGVTFRTLTEGPKSPMVELWLAFGKHAPNPLTEQFVAAAVAYCNTTGQNRYL